MNFKKILVLTLVTVSFSLVSCSSKEAKSDETIMGSASEAPAEATPVAAEPANLGKASSGQGR